VITKLTLKERVELARQEKLVTRSELMLLIEALWSEVERLRKHYQER
jgi:hypothetical protein